MSQSFTEITSSHSSDPGYEIQGLSGSFNGTAWIDYNADGYLDLFLTTSSGGNKMYKWNNSTEAYEEVTDITITDINGDKGGVWADYNNDGYLDVYVPGQGLYENSSGTSFSKNTDTSIPATTDGCWGDFNNDGLIDLLTVSTGFTLLENTNGSDFTEVTTGIPNETFVESSDCIWLDADNDGDMDFITASSILSEAENVYDQLYLNDGDETFTKSSDLGDIGGHRTFAIVSGDLDSDGDLDIYTVNIATLEPVTLFWDLSRSLIFDNDGTADFSHTTADFWNYGDVLNTANALDIDNDMDLDLFTLVKSDDVGNLNYLGINDGSGSFTDGTTDPLRDFNGLDGFNWFDAWGDYDQDGDLDVIVVSPDGTRLFRNDETGNNYVDVKLDGDDSNEFGLGAKVYIKISGDWQVREVADYSCNITPHFGIGTATSIQNIVVDWPSGYRSQKLSPAINTLVEISEPSDGTNGNLTLDDESSLSSSYTTGKTIEAGDIDEDTNGVILSTSGSITFAAGHTITLKKGFHAPSGSTFSAIVAEKPIFSGGGARKYSQSPETASIEFINNHEVGNALKIFPNPASNKLSIVHNNKDARIMEIRIYDMTGKTKLTKVVDSERSVLDIQSLPIGIYVVDVLTTTGRNSELISIIK